MKKALLSVVGVAVAMALSSVALAEDTNAAYSANAVGVVKYTIPAQGGLKCISLPLHPIDTSDAQGRWVWGETSLAQQLDNQSTVYFWNGLGWESFTKTVKGKWPSTITNRPIANGEAIFIRSAPSNTTDKIISLLGELPTEGEMSYDLTGGNNLDTRAVTAYPVEVPFAQTSLASNLVNQSSVYFWTGTSWETFTKTIKGKWPSTVTNRPVAVGEGVFVRSYDANASVVTESRPFTW